MGTGVALIARVFPGKSSVTTMFVARTAFPWVQVTFESAVKISTGTRGEFSKPADAVTGSTAVTGDPFAVIPLKVTTLSEAAAPRSSEIP